MIGHTPLRSQSHQLPTFINERVIFLWGGGGGETSCSLNNQVP